MWPVYTFRLFRICGAIRPGDTIAVMSTEQIVAVLIQEREKLNRAIAALQAGGTEAGNPAAEIAPKKKRHISAATRRKMALGQKRRHEAKKAAMK